MCRDIDVSSLDIDNVSIPKSLLGLLSRRKSQSNRRIMEAEANTDIVIFPTQRVYSVPKGFKEN